MGKRGIDQDLINSFGIGFAPKSNNKRFLYDILVKSFSILDLLASRVLSVDIENANIKDTAGSQRLVFPTMYKGKYTGFSLRTIFSNVDPKYKIVSGNRIVPIFNVDILEQNVENVYITEGIVDSLTLIQAGMPAIGIQGINNLAMEHSKYLDKFKGKLIIAFDSDPNKSGYKAIERVSKILMKMGLNEIYYIDLPSDGTKKVDINSFFLSYGRGTATSIFSSLTRYKCSESNEQKEKDRKPYYFSDLDTLSILDVVSSVAELKQVGPGRYKCNCPFPDHEDSTPSFYITYDGNFNSFKCHGCGRGGGPVTFLKHFYGLNDGSEAIKIWRRTTKC